MNFLSKFNIASQIHYKPIYRHDIYKKKIVINQKKFSDHFYKSQLTLPLHTRMSKGDIDYIHSKIKYFFSKA